MTVSNTFEIDRIKALNDGLKSAGFDKSHRLTPNCLVGKIYRSWKPKNTL